MISKHEIFCLFLFSNFFTTCTNIDFLKESSVFTLVAIVAEVVRLAMKRTERLVHVGMIVRVTVAVDEEIFYHSTMGTGGNCLLSPNR